MLRKIIHLISLAFLLAACGGSGPGAKIISVKYVDSIQSGGVSYHYEGQDIIEIQLDFKFDETLTAGMDPTSEDFRDQVFDMLYKGAHFYYKGEEFKLARGYWPVEAGTNFAKEMTLFYMVPSSHSVEDLRFEYDGAFLGEGAKSLDTEIKPSW